MIWKNNLKNQKRIRFLPLNIKYLYKCIFTYINLLKILKFLIDYSNEIRYITLNICLFVNIYKYPYFYIIFFDLLNNILI
jgi:presenilin-like A22 family membrane protease